jgi:uncharacterized protein (TIGR02118 family)
MTNEEFRKYWKETHAPLVVKVPYLKRYVQNAVLPETTSYHKIDGVAELWFDDADSLHHALDSPEWQTLGPDVANFADTERLSRLVVEETPLLG